jgi:hypothetical protein
VGGKISVQPEVTHLMPYTTQKTQALHQQGFASLMPACTSFNEQCGIIYSNLLPHFPGLYDK